MEQKLFNKKIHFSDEDDLLLSREVLGQNPYENPGRWNIIQINICQITGKVITVRTLRERMKNLVNKFLNKDKKQQFRSGIEEEINELDDLLRHIADMMKENKARKGTSQEISSYQKGFIQRENAISKNEPSTSACEIQDLNIPKYGLEIEIGDVSANNHSEIPLDISKENQSKNDFEKPSAKRTLQQKNILHPAGKRTCTGGLKQTTLNYLIQKNEKSYELRGRELALQERAQILQEKKFELDSWEKKKKVEMEEKKLNTELEIFKNQQKLIEIIFKKFDTV